jgi:glycerophosphoryl diester phosphodiesterase
MNKPEWLKLSLLTVRRLAIFELLYRLISLMIISPLSFFVLYQFVKFSGRPSIGNLELTGFFLSIPGIGSIVVFGTLLLAGLYFEICGLLLNLRPTNARIGNDEILRYLFRNFPRLIQLGLIQISVYLILLLPGAVITLIMMNQKWSGWDLNTLVILKPAIFWEVVVIGLLINGISGFFVIRQFLRWSMALPLLLFYGENLELRSLLSKSRELTESRLNEIAQRVIRWFIVQSFISFITLFLLSRSADFILDRVGFSLILAIPATIAILILHFLVVTFLSVILNVSFALILLEIYEKLTGQITVATMALENQRWKRYLPRITLIFFVMTTITLSVWAILVNSLDLEDHVEIIAHRAGGALAPENTIAAVKNAIAIQSEWAEIDVQLTRDSQIIVAHDTDLRRLAHVNKTVADCTLAEIELMEVGSAFRPEFRGEKIPTLDSFLEAARGQIRVVIELKPHSIQDAEPLAKAVVELLQRRGEVKRHRVCSLSYEAVQAVRRFEPEIELGFIVAQAVGPIEKLDADFFMIDQKMATQRLVERCRASGNRFVLAWTVDDPNKILPLIDNGVAGIITDNPPVIRERYEELRQLSTLGRLLIRVRDEIAD